MKILDELEKLGDKNDNVKMNWKSYGIRMIMLR